MSFVDDVCANVAQHSDSKAWKLKGDGNRKRAFFRVESPYGCVIDSYNADIGDVLPSKSRSYPKRVDKPEVSAVEGCRGTTFYNAHSYPTKVPPEAIRPFLEHFTRPGDVVLDPFSGSGMTGVAAAMIGRRAILNDLSVAGAHLGYNHTRPCSADKLEATFSSLYSELRPQFEELYGTTDDNGERGYVHYTLWSRRFSCPDCQYSFLLWDVIDQETGRIGAFMECPSCNSRLRRKSLKLLPFEPVLINYDSGDATVRKRLQRAPSDFDIQHIDSISTSDIDDWFPRVPLGSDRDMYNLSALHLQGIHELAHFYTPRNLKALSVIWRAIHAIEDDRVRHVLEFAFTNTAWHGTKMRRFNARGGQRPLTGTLYVPQLSSEVNVLEVMRNKVRHLVRYYTEYQPETQVLPAIRVGSAASLSDIPDASVDYVFTDPPFGSNIYYADCNVIAESWLGGITDTRSEAVVNRTIDVENGGKTLAEYQELMTSSLKEICRVLKPRAWATLVFHNTDSEVWRALQAAAVSAGFELEHAAGLDRKQHSHKGYKGRSGEENVAHFDVVMSMRKLPRSVKARKRPTADRRALLDIMNEILQDKKVAKKASLQWIHSCVLRRLVVEGYDLGSVSFSSTREIYEEMQSNRVDETDQTTKTKRSKRGREKTINQ